MADVGTRSFANYLSGLGEASLTAWFKARPDVLVEPVPRGFSQLAQRLGGAESLAAALRTANRDTVIVGQAVAALGSSATVSGLARLLSASEQAVRNGVAELCGRGLAWDSSGIVFLLERLEAHWLADIGGGRPLATIAGSVLAENLRAAVGAFGAATEGLRKPELAARLSEFMTDLPLMAKVIAGLPQPAKARLGEFRRGYQDYHGGFGRSRPRASARDPNNVLIAAGLLLAGVAPVAAWAASFAIAFMVVLDAAVDFCDLCFILAQVGLRRSNAYRSSPPWPSWWPWSCWPAGRSPAAAACGSRAGPAGLSSASRLTGGPLRSSSPRQAASNAASRKRSCRSCPVCGWSSWT